jgi:uncharacterized SAM-binding protein YcdF (DUF218 family)
VTALSSLTKTIGGLAALGVLVLMAGFFVFCATLPRAGSVDLGRTAAFEPEERGIVVLTGDGGARIERGLDLKEQGLGARVFISGVHPRTTKTDLETMGSPATLQCCVDLGPWARTTKGNAVESRDWLRNQGYKAAILVTSDFHLPRAMAELQHAAPELALVGVPVPTTLAPEKGWMARLSSWRLLVGEYAKYLVVRIRSIF